MQIHNFIGSLRCTVQYSTVESVEIQYMYCNSFSYKKTMPLLNCQFIFYFGLLIFSTMKLKKGFFILTLTYLVIILSAVDYVQSKNILRNTAVTQSEIPTSLVTDHSTTLSTKSHGVSVVTTNSETISQKKKNPETSTPKTLSTINLTNDYHTGKSTHQLV